MASVVGLCVSPPFGFNTETKSRFNVQVRSSSGGDSRALSSDSILVNGISTVEDKQRIDVLLEKENGRLNGKHGLVGKDLKEKVVEELEPFWDDGYGSESVIDYFASAKEMIKEDGAPPRWFCPVAAGCPLNNSPILLFLPGFDGTGWGLVMHHKALGKAFEVRCLHIPVHDRTPFEELIKLVEETIKHEHTLSPNKPIYLVGDSLGGCLALAVAARNPNIDLVLILTNPATSFGRSQLQPFLPILEGLPDAFHTAVPYALSFIMGDPVKMAAVTIESGISPIQRLELLSQKLTALLPYLSELANIIPKESLLWKLQLLKSAAAYANSRLHAVKAEVLVLASEKDNMVPSVDEAKRLKSLLKNCSFRYFKEHGHTLLLEDGVSLLTVIKGIRKYRRSRRHDSVLDFLPPSKSEFKYAMEQVVGLLRFAAGSVMFSTLENGTIVRGLAGVPNEGPVLLVGYHNIMGLELFSLVEEFLREKKIMVRGLAHPELFFGNFEDSMTEFSISDWLKVFGAVPVSAGNLFKLLSRKSHILLYPGGVREALHFKGEEYKLFWPDQPEFVRMAARFGATIVPFGAVGEDDLTNLVLDYNDLKKIPVLNDYLKEANAKSIKVRDETRGEVGNPDVFVPVLLPKIPGRMYYMFGKPVQTKGREEILTDKKMAKQLYSQIKSEVENCLAYLVEKREKDPFRSVVDRTIYKAIYSPSRELPTFDP